MAALDWLIIAAYTALMISAGLLAGRPRSSGSD